MNNAKAAAISSSPKVMKNIPCRLFIVTILDLYNSEHGGSKSGGAEQRNRPLKHTGLGQLKRAETTLQQ
jgi:hypothetical protein